MARRTRTTYVLDEILVDCLMRANGETLGGFLFDCGPLNHGGAISGLLPQLLVDLGVFAHVRILVYQQHHGKGLADQLGSAPRSRRSGARRCCRWTTWDTPSRAWVTSHARAFLIHTP